MRVFATAAAVAFAAMMAWSSSVGAVDVEIHGYPFGCRTPDGETRKPKFGDVGGMYFAGLPQGRKACLETIDRMIYSCGANTTFISHDLNNQYADCLPIFEQQAKWCARHFELQRSKCDAGGSSAPAEPAEAAAVPAVEPADVTMWALKRSNLRGGPGTDHAKVGLLEVGDEVQVMGEIGDWLRIEAPGGGEAFVYGPLLGQEAPSPPSAAIGAPGRLCDSEGDDRSCWREIADNPGCHLWEHYSWRNNRASSWSGSCLQGVADGSGTLVWKVWDLYSKEEFTVEDAVTILQGKRHGEVVRHFPNTGAITEGQYNRGTAHGKWILYASDGSCVSVTEYLEGLVDKRDLHCKEHSEVRRAGSGADLLEEPAEVAAPSPTADTAQAGPLHGAITFSQEADGGYAWGIAWSFDSPAGAVAEATDQCREYGGTGCEEAGWFENACGALAIGDGNGYGTGGGSTTAEAERDALAQCRAANADCRVEVARCSQSQEAGGKGRRQEEDTVAAREPEKAKPAAVVLEPKCPADYFAPSCWREVANKPGCHFWQNFYDGIMIMSPSGVTWSGSCVGAFAVGEGTLAAANENHSFALMGRLENGKKQGRWVDIHEYFSSVDRHEGPYVDGERNGHWIQSSRGGGIGADNDQEGSYLYGKLHGEWITHTPGAGQHGEDMCNHSRYSNGDLVLLEDC